MLNDRLRERLVDLEQEYESVLAALNDPDLSADPARLREVSRRHRELDEVVGCFRRLEAAYEDLEAEGYGEYRKVFEGAPIEEGAAQ